jgi:hypothetical protein
MADSLLRCAYRSEYDYAWLQLRGLCWYDVDLLTDTLTIRKSKTEAALDQLNPGTAQMLFEIHQQLAQVPGVRCLNNPQNALQRFELLTKLHHLGRNDFRAVREGGDLKGLRFHVFLREERSRIGVISPLLSSEREISLAHPTIGVRTHSLARGGTDFMTLR